MASTCSSSSCASSSSLCVTKKYDVFISFRGEDTRGGFTSHLHAALCRNNIVTYIDDNMQKGDNVWVELMKAIKESSLFLVIFSMNYASSSWCLSELVELMECKKKQEDVDVIPVFYRINPSQVRKQSGSYDVATTNQKWKDALSEAANLSGFHSLVYRTESDLIEGIIKAVLQKLNHKSINDVKGHFIRDDNYRNIESLLKIDAEEVQVIGIWGMGGIGKTALGVAIFEKVSSQYEGSCLLENVAEESKRHGHNYLRKKLLSKLLREDLDHIDTGKVLCSYVKRRLRSKKVFIVLDDVTTLELLENLVTICLECKAGSKVIVTTRDKHVLISGNVDIIHEVREMNFQNSLKIFSLNAFGKTYPVEEYEMLSKSALNYCQGIPLALKVLGSFLRSKSKNEWDSALSKLKKIPKAEIQAVLRLSYDELDDDEKNIFLDIACFLKGKERVHVTTILNACDFSANIGIRNLLDKALVHITSTAYHDCINMHNLIQEMGKEIIREESIKNPGQRSRLWDPKEIYDLLTNNKGTDAVEGIWLDMTHVENMNLKSKAFRKMPNLRLLAFESINGDSSIINSVYLPKGLKFLPKNLRYFGWEGYPLEYLPTSFCPQKLVVLCFKNSKVERLWHGVQNLPNLEKIDLDYSKQLVECPDLSRAQNLKYLFLRNCESLTYIDPSILSFPKFETLDVAGCKSLKSLNSNTWSKSLKGLYLRGSGLNEVPPSIFLIKKLRTFSFYINSSLVDLPEEFTRNILLSESREHEGDSFSNLHKLLPSPAFRSLVGLLFDECPKMCKIPNNISLISTLENLILCRSAIISLPESIKDLPRLRRLEVSHCESLQCIPALPRSIEHCVVWRCPSLQKIVLSCSMVEPSKKLDCILLLPNCTKLDEHAYDSILEDVLVRIELGSKPPSTTTILENEEDASVTVMRDCLNPSTKICYSFPVTSDKVIDWLHWHFKSTQALDPIEQFPPNLWGFFLCFVVSPFQSHHIGCCASIGCECYLETRGGEKINVKSFFLDKKAMVLHPSPFEFTTDHAFLWYDGQLCKQIMEVIKEREVNNSCDQKLTFKFFVQNQCNHEAMIIKECGFRWIYSSPRSDEQEETLPPTKKLKSETSNFEVEESKELRWMRRNCVL